MRKKLTVWIGIFLLLVCSVTGCTKSLEEQIAEQLELGQKYLSELNYEEAIVAFTKAIELDEKNVDAYIGRGQVYEVMAQAAGEESADGKAYYKQAAGEYEQALSLSSENAFLYDRLLTIYQITENLEKIQELTEKALSGITDEAILTEMEQVKIALEAVQKIAAACEAGEIDWVFDFMNSEEFTVLQQFAEEMETQVFMEENGKGLGIYPTKTENYGETMIYYGDYQDGQRQGHGLWLGVGNGKSYQAEGEWSNDVPNGSQEVRENHKIMIGSVTDGLWHGVALENILKFGYEYPVTLEHGKYVILWTEEDDDGMLLYIISDSGPRDEYDYPICYLTHDPEQVHGIEGFTP